MSENLPQKTPEVVEFEDLDDLGALAPTPTPTPTPAPATLDKPPAVNILKTRDDREPVQFTVDKDGKCKVIEGENPPSWAPSKEGFESKILRQRIEPWLTSLFQSEHFSLLIGSGLTRAVHILATGRGATDMAESRFSVHEEKIALSAKKSSELAGRKAGNFEDAIRVANELIAGLEILDDTAAATLKTEVTTKLSDFAQSILTSETGIATANEAARENAFNTLVNFLMSFASRTGTRDRLSIFTTNYDRLLETGAEIAGLHLVDRFVGNLTPIFRSSRLDIDMHYNPPGIRGEPRYLEGVARFSKIHGSVDWVQAGGEIRRMGVPFGAGEIAPYLKAPGLGEITAHKLMIYPNSAKDRETAHYPYVELFRDFAAAVCRPNSTLVTYGYSFGDEHINRIIEDMLTIPSTHLVVISFDDPLGRIMAMYKKLGRGPQITLVIGPELGDLAKLTDSYLPKSAIDRATFRMSELLKMRFGTQERDDSAPKSDSEKTEDIGL